MKGIAADEIAGMKLLESYRYWSKRRILFNLVVGVAGLFSVFRFLNTVVLFDMFGMLIWGIVANALYSTGYSLESYVITQSQGQKTLERGRAILFWIGTVAYIIVSVLFVMLYALSAPC